MFLPTLLTNIHCHLQFATGLYLTESIQNDNSATETWAKH